MKKQLQVILLPWSAFGHMIPFRLLAIALAKRGVKVTFVSTPRNISRIPQIPDSLKELLTYHAIALPIPTTGEDPLNGGEATSDVPIEKFGLLKAAYDGLRDPFEELVVKLCPDWIIHDMVGHWAPEIARDHSIPSVYYTIVASTMEAFFSKVFYNTPQGRVKTFPTWEALTSPPPWFDFPTTVAYNKPEAIMFYPMIYGDNSSCKSNADRLQETIAYTTARAFRTCAEFDGDFLNVMEKIQQKAILPLGFLLPDDEPRKENSERDSHWRKIFDWLDEQQERSVVYVAFGSEFEFSREDIAELAHGLELSGQPFLWSLRRPFGAKDDKDVLPEGFDPVKGVVSLGWSPQMDVLAHRSVGGCLIHCGWGSIVESLHARHNLILLPGILDQPLNARLLVEKGIGVEIRKNEDGSITREAVSEAVTYAMVSEAGMQMRGRIEEISDSLFRNRKLQEEYVDKFVHFLHTNLIPKAS